MWSNRIFNPDVCVKIFHLMLKHGADLCLRDSGKPVQEILDSGALGEVSEQGGYRNSGAGEDPCPAEPVGHAFDGWAGTPVGHVITFL